MSPPQTVPGLWLAERIQRNTEELMQYTTYNRFFFSMKSVFQDFNRCVIIWCSRKSQLQHLVVRKSRKNYKTTKTRQNCPVMAGIGRKMDTFRFFFFWQFFFHLILGWCVSIDVQLLGGHECRYQNVWWFRITVKKLRKKKQVTLDAPGTVRYIASILLYSSVSFQPIAALGQFGAGSCCATCFFWQFFAIMRNHQTIAHRFIRLNPKFNGKKICRLTWRPKFNLLMKKKRLTTKCCNSATNNHQSIGYLKKIKKLKLSG